MTVYLVHIVTNSCPKVVTQAKKRVWQDGGGLCVSTCVCVSARHLVVVVLLQAWALAYLGTVQVSHHDDDCGYTGDHVASIPGGTLW